MLIDIRIYQCKSGMREEFFELYEKYGRGPQTRILGKPYSFVKSIEDPNEFILMWSYEDLADREAKRAAMWADPDWIAYTQESAKLGALEAQENKLMTPVDFFDPPR